MTNCEEAFGFNPKKIILTGDSAGGNLILALTVLAVERNFRKPDGVVPVFATTITSDSYFWPSLIFGIDDVILTQSFLNLCLSAYTPEGREYRHIGLENHHISPGLCPDEVLSRFPPCRLMIAGADSFKDDNYKFMDRMIRNGVDVKAKEFRLMPHGFLSFIAPAG